MSSRRVSQSAAMEESKSSKTKIGKKAPKTKAAPRASSKPSARKEEEIKSN